MHMRLRSQVAKALHIQGEVVVVNYIELVEVVEKHKLPVVVVVEMGKVVAGKVLVVVKEVEVNALHRVVEEEEVLYKVVEMVAVGNRLVEEESGQEEVAVVINMDKQVVEESEVVVEENDEVVEAMAMAVEVSCSSKAQVVVGRIQEPVVVVVVNVAVEAAEEA